MFTISTPRAAAASATLSSWLTRMGWPKSSQPKSLRVSVRRPSIQARPRTYQMK